MSVRDSAFLLLLSFAWTLACAPRAVAGAKVVPPALESNSKPDLVCTYSYGGESKRLRVPPTRDPYSVKAESVFERFEFKVVYVDAPEDIAGVRVYTYSLATDEPVLIHEAKFGVSQPSRGRFGFTGQQLLYDPRGREFQYYCEWVVR